MRKIIGLLCVVGALAVSLPRPAYCDQDYGYSVMGELQRLGYVEKVEDTDQMAMQFRAQCNAQAYYRVAKRGLLKMGFILDRQNADDEDGIYQITTEWNEHNTSGPAAFFSGVKNARARWVINIQSDPGNGMETTINARVEAEISKGGNWHPEVVRDVRNVIRRFMVSTLARPIYGDSNAGLDEAIRAFIKDKKPMPTREEFTARYGVRAMGVNRAPEAPASEPAQNGNTPATNTSTP